MEHHEKTGEIPGLGDCQALGRNCNAQYTTNSFWHEAADAKCLFFARYWGKDNQ
jgi:hypothetical protein